MAETIGIGQLRADTCAYLNRAAGGDTLQVIRRGRLAARIEPVPRRPPCGEAEGQVITVQLSGFRSQASRYLDWVGSGGTIHVHHRGRALVQICAAGA